jgi:hypothetical protein
MKFKTMLVGVLLAGSMQQAWGMYRAGGYEPINPRNPGQNSPSAPLMSPSNSIRPSNSNNPPSSSNNNNSSAPRQEVSDIAELVVLIKALSLNVETMHKEVNDRMTKMEKKIDTVEKKVGGMTKNSDYISLYDLKKEIEAVKSKVDNTHRAVADVKSNLKH